jgi:hypothetical protein
MQMPVNVKRCVWILAVVLSMGIAGGSLRAAVPPSPRDQGHEQDYSKNKKYQRLVCGLVRDRILRFRPCGALSRTGPFTNWLSSSSFPGPMREAAVGDCSFCVSVPTISHPSVSMSCFSSSSDASCSSADVFWSCASIRMVAGLTSDSGRWVIFKSWPQMSQNV